MNRQGQTDHGDAKLKFTIGVRYGDRSLHRRFYVVSYDALCGIRITLWHNESQNHKMPPRTFTYRISRTIPGCAG